MNRQPTPNNRPKFKNRWPTRTVQTLKMIFLCAHEGRVWQQIASFKK